MSKPSNYQSALGFVEGDDDAVVLVVGGLGGTGKEAELLSSHPRQSTGEQSNGDKEWKWLQLSPMLHGRPCRPGVLLLGGERVLVCGGGGGGSGGGEGRCAEILQMPRGDNDKGMWTMLTHSMTQDFWKTFFIKFNHRIVAVGELLMNIVTKMQKGVCPT